MQGERDKAKKEMNELASKKDEEVKEMAEAKAKMSKELEEFKSEFQMKMTEVKLMQMELEEKLAVVQDDDGGD